MKINVHFIGLILIFLLTCSVLNGQSFPTPESSPEWSLSGFPGSDLVSEELWVDSTGMEIDGVLWYSITSARAYNPVNGWLPDTAIIGSYRVDGDKTYFRDYSDNEGLMYDFSAELGDTLELLSPGGLSDVIITYRVVDVDTVTCNSLARKRLTLEFDQFNRTYVSIWVEGIGDVYHPFVPGVCSSISCSIIFYGGELEVDDLSVTLEGALTCNTLSSTLNRNAKGEVRVSPNPFGNNLELSFDEAIYGERVSINLLDSYGRSVIKDEVNNLQYINTRNLKSGIYFLILTSKRGRNTITRLIKK